MKLKTIKTGLKKTATKGTSGQTRSGDKPLDWRKKTMRRSVMDREGISDYEKRMKREALGVLRRAKEIEARRLEEGWRWVRRGKGFVLKVC